MSDFKKLSDVEWMNIVNHDRAYYGWRVEDAVHHAVSMTERKLAEINGGDVDKKQPKENEK